MHTHTGSSLHNRVNLTFDLLTSMSLPVAGTAMHYVCVPSLMLIAQAVLQTLRQTDTQSHTPLITLATQRLRPARVINAGYSIVSTS